MQPKNGNATGAAVVRAGVLRGFVLAAGSSAAATLTLHDNASAGSGTVLGVVAAPQGDSVAVTGLVVPFSAGVYATLTGTGAQFTVYVE